MEQGKRYFEECPSCFFSHTMKVNGDWVVECLKSSPISFMFMYTTVQNLGSLYAAFSSTKPLQL